MFSRLLAARYEENTKSETRNSFQIKQNFYVAYKQW